jgi:hypothetical protein
VMGGRLRVAGGLAPVTGLVGITPTILDVLRLVKALGL